MITKCGESGNWSESESTLGSNKDYYGVVNNLTLHTLGTRLALADFSNSLFYDTPDAPKEWAEVDAIMFMKLIDDFAPYDYLYLRLEKQR